MDLNTLQQLMRSQGADATANTALQSRLAEAQALRGSVPQAEASTGYVDPLSVITSLIQGSKGRKQVAELQPRAEMAQRRVNELGAAKEQYGLSLAADKVRQKQANYETDRGDKVQSALKLATAQKEQQNRAYDWGVEKFDETNLREDDKEETRQQELSDKLLVESGKRTEVMKVNPDTKETESVLRDAKGNLYRNGELIEEPSRWKNYEKPSGRGARGGFGGGLKPTGSERKAAIEAKRLKGVSDEMNTLFAEMSEEEQAELNQPYKEALVDTLLPTSAQRIAESKMYKSPKVKTYKTRVSRYESKLSQLAAGLNVTGFEMKDRQKWSPNAAGVDQAERQRRLDNVERDLLGQVDAFNEYYPDYAIPDDSRKVEEPIVGTPPEGVNAEEWAQLSEEEQAYFLENMQ